MANDMIKLGGLWGNKDKDGNTYLTGKLSPQVKILIFKNKYRESENHPTHIMYLSQVETPGQQAEGAEEDDAFSPAQQPRPVQQYTAPEDLPEEEFATTRRSTPRPPQQASTPQQRAYPPRRGPAPPPDYDQDQEAPF